jgi:hypothetical protein
MSELEDALALSNISNDPNDMIKEASQYLDQIEDRIKIARFNIKRFPKAYRVIRLSCQNIVYETVSLQDVIKRIEEID